MIIFFKGGLSNTDYNCGKTKKSYLIFKAKIHSIYSLFVFKCEGIKKLDSLSVILSEL